MRKRQRREGSGSDRESTSRVARRQPSIGENQQRARPRSSRGDRGGRSAERREAQVERNLPVGQSGEERSEAERNRAERERGAIAVLNQGPRVVNLREARM